MNTKNTLKFSIILKRSSCLNSITESTFVDSEKLFNNLKSVMERCKTGTEAGVQKALRSYLDSIYTVENASKYYYQPIYLVEYFNIINPTISTRILNEFNNSILPYVENISLVEEYVNNSPNGMSQEQRDSVLEACAIMEVADRIIKNHDMLCKRFNMENEANRFKTMGLKYLVDSCAMKISTYNIKSYQKLNLTMEEVSYLLQKSGYEYDKKDLIKYSVNYFLAENPYISNTELNNFARVLEESYLFEESDLDGVSKLLSNSDNGSRSINNCIQRYLAGPKTDTITQMVIDTITSTSKEDILYNIDNLVYFLWDLWKADTDYIIFKERQKTIAIVFSSIYDIIKLSEYFNVNDSNPGFNKNDIDIIIDKLEKVSKTICNYGNIDNLFTTPAVAFNNSGLIPLINNLKAISSSLYSESNLENIAFVNNSNVESVALKEFKLFKFHNLVNAAFNLDKFLKVKEKKLISKAKNKVNKFVKKAKNVLFGEASEIKENFYSYIGSDMKAEICIRQYPIDESDYSDITNFLENVCNEYNDLLLSQNMNSVRVYYTILPGMAEINIKESAMVNLEESDIDKVYHTLDVAEESYIDLLIETEYALSKFENYDNVNLQEYISDFSRYDNFTNEQFELALEAMKYIGIDKDSVKLFGQKYSDYKFNECLSNGTINESYIKLANDERKISGITEKWEPEENVPGDIELEALDYLLSIFEASLADDWDNDDEDNDEEEEKKEDKKEKSSEEKKDKSSTGSASKPNTQPAKPTSSSNTKYRSKISLNGIKLGLIGLRNKYKEFNTKQKEISQNLDNAARAFAKAIKESLVSDRREAIIKGSLLPSFSRCIKNGIILAGLGVATGNIVVPIITAMGGLALSKKLTKNERMLLLDDIEIELEVVEKELQMAEANNEINKYRALLQYKKDLQRQYQRIRYNIRVGKDILPNSTTGVKQNN